MTTDHSSSEIAQHLTTCESFQSTEPNTVDWRYDTSRWSVLSAFPIAKSSHWRVVLISQRLESDGMTFIRKCDHLPLMERPPELSWFIKPVWHSAHFPNCKRKNINDKEGIKVKSQSLLESWWWWWCCCWWLWYLASDSEALRPNKN